MPEIDRIADIHNFVKVKDRNGSGVLLCGAPHNGTYVYMSTMWSVIKNHHTSPVLIPLSRCDVYIVIASLGMPSESPVA